MGRETSRSYVFSLALPNIKLSDMKYSLHQGQGACALVCHARGTALPGNTCLSLAYNFSPSLRNLVPSSWALTSLQGLALATRLVRKLLSTRYPARKASDGRGEGFRGDIH